MPAPIWTVSDLTVIGPRPPRRTPRSARTHSLEADRCRPTSAAPDGRAKASPRRRLVQKFTSRFRGKCRTCVIDGVLEHSPAEHVRRPALPAESPTLGFSQLQFEALLTAARESPNPCDFALVAMLGLLGLRIFEATGADITDLGEEHGHRVLRVCGKGTKVVLVPLPPAVGRAIDRAAGDRTRGPVLLNSRGVRMDRHAVHSWPAPGVRTMPRQLVLRVEWFDDRFAGVLVDHGTAEPDDLAAPAELVHEERVQAVHAGHGDVDQKVVAASHDEYRQDLGQGHRVRLEALDHGAAERPDLQVQQCLDAAVERGEADLRVIPGYHPAIAQRPDPFQTGRRRDADRPSQFTVGLPRMCLQMSHDRRIKFVHERDYALFSDHRSGPTR
jgi:hypothetical protein